MDVVRIPLAGKYAGGRFALVDARDAKQVLAFTWHASLEGGGQQKKLYARSWVRGSSTNMKMHRLIMEAPPGVFVDHINGDGLDNRRVNLRLATHSQNLWNRRHVGASTGFKGVTLEGVTFSADIRHNGKKCRRRGFATAIEAAAWYDAMALELRGEYACTNADLGLI